jgi:uncharacterized membrane protein YeaQ/YmgE (transglycosylase-associated protein family)
MYSDLLAQVATAGGPQDNLIVRIVVWLFIGLVAGFIGSRLVNKHGEGVGMDIVLGLVGSFVGGFIFNLFGIGGSGGLIFSIVVATFGAIIVLAIYHAFFHPRAV